MGCLARFQPRGESLPGETHRLPVRDGRGDGNGEGEEDDGESDTDGHPDIVNNPRPQGKGTAVSPRESDAVATNHLFC